MPARPRWPCTPQPSPALPATATASSCHRQGTSAFPRLRFRSVRPAAGILSADGARPGIGDGVLLCWSRAVLVVLATTLFSFRAATMASRSCFVVCFRWSLPSVGRPLRRACWCSAGARALALEPSLVLLRTQRPSTCVFQCPWVAGASSSATPAPALVRLRLLQPLWLAGVLRASAPAVRINVSSRSWLVSVVVSPYQPPSPRRLPNPSHLAALSLVMSKVHVRRSSPYGGGGFSTNI